MTLTFSEQIKIILKRQGKTVQDLANLLNTSLQNINQQLKRDNFKEKDMQRIAAVLGYDVFVEVKEKDARGAGENTPIKNNPSIENNPVNDPMTGQDHAEAGKSQEYREPTPEEIKALDSLLNSKRKVYNKPETVGEIEKRL